MSTKRLAKDKVKTQTKVKPKQSTQKAGGNEKSIRSKADRRQQRRKNRRLVRRIFPIWLRLIVVLLLCGIALIVGLMIGYGLIGDGNPSDALKLETWQHIKDIVKQKD